MAATILGCEDRLLVSLPDLPADIAWLAAVSEDQGNRVGSTPLLAVGSAHLLSDMEAVGTTVTVFGATEADVEHLDLSEPKADRVRRSVGAEPSWKSSWAAQGPVTGGTAELTVSEPPYELTADWLPKCPSLLQGSSPVWTTCEPRPCRAIAQQIGCTLKIQNDAACAWPNMELSVGPEGTVSRPTAELHGTCRHEPVSRSAFSVRCSGGSLGECRVGATTKPLDAPVQFESLSIVDGPFTPQRIHDELRGGYLFDIARLRQRMLVAYQESPDDDWACQRAPSRLAIVDVDRFEVVKTTTAASCLRSLTTDVSGARVFGLAGGAHPDLVELDAEGRILRRQRLEAPEIQGTQMGIDIIALGDGTALVALLRPFDEDSEENALAVRIDPESLEILDVTSLLGTRPLTLLAHPVKDDRYFSLEFRAGLVSEYRGTDLTLSFPLGLACGTPQLAPQGLSYNSANDALVVADAGQAGRVLALRATEVESCQVNNVTEARVPVASASWRDPELALVFSTDSSDGDGDSYAGLFWPTKVEPQFVSEPVAIARGPISHRFEMDEAGRTWVLATGAGTVVRVY